VDLALGHVAALNFNDQNEGIHTFNLGRGEGVTVLEMIRAYEYSSGQLVRYNISPRRQGDVAECYANPSKANAILNWVAKRGVEEICESAFKFYTLKKRIYEKLFNKPHIL
jgi:UDP-glucose 4-epimerase